VGKREPDPEARDFLISLAIAIPIGLALWVLFLLIGWAVTR